MCCMLHCPLYFQPHPRHAPWQACRCSLRAAHSSVAVQPLWSARAARLLQRTIALGGNVRHLAPRSTCMADRAGTGHRTLPKQMAHEHPVAHRPLPFVRGWATLGRVKSWGTPASQPRRRGPLGTPSRNNPCLQPLHQRPPARSPRIFHGAISCNTRPSASAHLLGVRCWVAAAVRQTHQHATPSTPRW